MRQSESQQPESRENDLRENNEARLRREVADLRRQLEERGSASHHGPSQDVWKPSGWTIFGIALVLVLVIIGAFFAGYIPLQKRNAIVQAEARQDEQAVPRVDVIEVGRGSQRSQLELPGNIQAATEAPILSRADGYIRRRLVDIGDRVKAGTTVLGKW